MLARVLAIALNTYRESVRARILLGLAGVAFAVSFYSIVVGAFTLKEAARVVSDLGTASMSIFSIAVAIVIGATSLHRELEQKTVFPILARPIRRGEYLVGKYFGTLLTILVFIMADAGLLLLIGAAMAGRAAAMVVGVGAASTVALAIAAYKLPSARTYGFIPWALLLVIGGALLSGNAPDERRVVLASSVLSFLEVAILAAVATLFASFSTPFLSSLLTLGLFLVGRSADSLARLPVKSFGQAMHDAGAALAKVVPNLQIYVPPRPLLTGEALDAALPQYIARGALLSFAWSFGLLAFASFIFKKRDFL